MLRNKYFFNPNYQLFLYLKKKNVTREREFLLFFKADGSGFQSLFSKFSFIECRPSFSVHLLLVFCMLHCQFCRRCFIRILPTEQMSVARRMTPHAQWIDQYQEQPGTPHPVPSLYFDQFLQLVEARC